MRKLIFGLFIAISGISCGGGQTPLFEMDLEAELLIRAGLNSLDTHTFFIRDVPTRITSYSLSSFEDIDQILASNARIEDRVLDFDFTIIDQITIDVISKSDPNNQKEIFYNNLIPFNEQTELRLFSSLSEVSEILTQDLVDLQIKIRFRRFTPREIEAKFFMTFNAYATE